MINVDMKTVNSQVQISIPTLPLDTPLQWAYNERYTCH